MDLDVLPSRDATAEDAWVRAWTEVEDTERLRVAVDTALSAGRPQLAARLVGLLPDDDADPALARARKAAAFLIHDGLGPEDVSWSALDEAWRDVRKRRMARIRARMRRAMDPGRGHSRSGRRR